MSRRSLPSKSLSDDELLALDELIERVLPRQTLCALSEETTALMRLLIQHPVERYYPFLDRHGTAIPPLGSKQNAMAITGLSESSIERICAAHPEITHKHGRRVVIDLFRMLRVFDALPPAAIKRDIQRPGPVPVLRAPSRRQSNAEPPDR